MAGFTEQYAGQRWRDQISKGVRGANWFILLLPDPSDELDWCLFETGLFEAQLTSADRLICLHHPDTEVPSPIQGYQAIAATLPEAEKFLRMVFVGDDPVPGLRPINRAIEKRIPELARQLVDAIRVPKRRLNREIFEPWIEMSVVRRTQLNSKEDLDSATIVSANDEALELFGFNVCPKTFAKSAGGDRREQRRRSLARAAVSRTAQDRPWQDVLAGPGGVPVPQREDVPPIAIAIDRAGPNGPVQTYHISFAEDVTTADTAAMPREAGAAGDFAPVHLPVPMGSARTLLPRATERRRRDPPRRQHEADQDRLVLARNDGSESDRGVVHDRAEKAHRGNVRGVEAIAQPRADGRARRRDQEQGRTKARSCSRRCCRPTSNSSRWPRDVSPN